MQGQSFSQIRRGQFSFAIRLIVNDFLRICPAFSCYVSAKLESSSISLKEAALQESLFAHHPEFSFNPVNNPIKANEEWMR